MKKMKSHINMLNRVLSVIPGAACETSIVGETAVTDITYKDIEIHIKQVGVIVYFGLSSKNWKVTIETDKIDVCTEDLIRYISREIGQTDYTVRAVPTAKRPPGPE